jgi:hypothetical protein
MMTSRPCRRPCGLTTVPLCRPGLGEMLKWGWIQFMCIYTPLLWLLSWFERCTFRYRMLETRIVWDAALGARSTHKF